MLAPTVLDARRLRYGLVRGHPTSKSQEQTVFRHPVSAGRIRDYHLFSAKDQSSVLPSIAGLLRSRGPIAVLFAVVAFVVSSLKAGSLGALSHVIKKCLKTTIPFFGNVDAATTVSVEVRPMRLRTTSTHVHPNSVFCCVGAPVRLIDASEVFAALVPLSASAGCGAPAKQARGERNKPAHPAVAIACGVSLRSISYAKAPESFSWDNESTLDSILTLSAPTGNSATPTKCI